MNSISLSIQIPTLNSASTVAGCIDSALAPSPHSVEILVIDGGSSDLTLEIAASKGARVIHESQGLLYSRLAGIRNTDSEWTLLLDSDQEIAPGSLSKLNLDSDYDMIVLGESSFPPENFLQHLYEADRLVSGAPTSSADPVRGAVMPRLFRTDILKLVASRIPSGIPGKIRYPDHAIIYFEASQITKRLGFSPNFLLHHENANLQELLRKHYKYGLDAAIVSAIPRYSSLVLKKSSPIRPRPPRGMTSHWALAELLMILKGVPFSLGFAISRSRAPTIRKSSWLGQ